MANYGELSLLEQARSGGGSGERGAATLGAVLGGGARRSQEAFNNGAYSGAKLADVLAQARQRQQAEVGRQASYHAALAKGDNELANMFLYANPNEVADYEGKHQKTGYTKQAWDNATSPTHDDSLTNRMLSVIEGKPQQLTKIEGDTVINPMVTPDQQHLQTTEVGKAVIGEKGAQAHSAMTAADLHDAEAGAARALTANRHAELPTIGANKVRKFSEPEMSAALGGAPDEKGKQRIDPLRLAAFLKKQAEMPQANDADVFNAMKNDEIAQNTQAANTPSDDMQNSLSAMAGAPATPKVGDSPHPEGTQLRGPDGKLYVVKNGQPVPL